MCVSYNTLMLVSILLQLGCFHFKPFIWSFVTCFQ